MGEMKFMFVSHGVCSLFFFFSIQCKGNISMHANQASAIKNK